MNGSFLRFYVHEGHRIHGVLAWEWLLKKANDLGLQGGSAFRALAGFGRHHILHEQTFFELAGSVAVEVEFIVTEAEGHKLVELLHKEKLRIFFAYIPARFGIINPDDEDPPELASID
jgi:PII-like signaling protein